MEQDRVVFYILIVAVVNLALGFGVAVFLARRSADPAAVAGDWSDATLDAAATAPREPDSDPTLDAAALDPEEPVSDSSPDTDEEILCPWDEQDAIGDETVEDSTPAPAPAVEEPGPPSSDQDREVSPGEASVEQLHDSVERYNQQLVEVDDQLRDCAESGDADSIRTCLDSLQTANSEYLAACGDAHEAFEQLYAEQQGFQTIRECLKEAMDVQASNIRETNEAIESLDYDADANESCRDMVNHTSRLLDANHQVRDAVGEAAVGVARSQESLDSLSEPSCNDPLTGLISRVGLEKELQQWWSKEANPAKRLSVAMLDLDEFCRINERHGEKAGDRVLRAIGQLLDGESRRRASAAKLSGQRFLLMFTDSDPQVTTNVIEHLRQQIQVAHFVCDKSDIRVTVSCAVSGAAHDDTPDSLFARAEAALREAKRYGRNRTFLDEGGYPTPVVPPNFSLEDKFISI